MPKGETVFKDPKGKHDIEITYKCLGAAGGDKKDAAGTKEADEKACDALKDASDDAKAECKKYAGKKCADEADDTKKKECEAAKASAKTLVAGAMSLVALASLM